MKVYVLGSTSFMKEMVATRDQLRELGFDGWIHPNYEAFVRGEKLDQIERVAKGEHAAVKRENDYLRVHYKHILESDAVLVVNLKKNGIESYIGGNALIEMGQAYVNDKTIFLLNDIPNMPYAAEIECMDPVCLHGDLKNISEWQNKADTINLFAELSALNLPPDQYIVVGSGILAARGIRETRDLDLVLSPELFQQYQQKGWKEKMRPNGKPSLTKGKVELYLDVNAGNFNPTFEELKSRQQVIQGFPFISLRDLLKFKQAYGREKDLKDIEILQTLVKA